MISLIDIKKAIVKKLKYIKGVNVVANDIRSGFDKPAFFVQLMHLGTDSDCDIQETLINVYIHYFSDDKTDLSNLKMTDTLNSLFVNSLKLNDRTLTLYNKSSDIDDNVLKFMFTLKYTESTPDPIDETVEKYENMQELHLDLERGEYYGITRD